MAHPFGLCRRSVGRVYGWAVDDRSPLLWAMRLALPAVLVMVAITFVGPSESAPLVMLAGGMLALTLGALYYTFRRRS